MSSAHFSPRERLIAGAFAEALFPGGRIVPPGGAATVDRLETILRGFGSDTLRGYTVLLHGLDLAPLLRHRKRFAAMSLAEREAYLQSWLDGDFTERARLVALSAPVKVAHLDDPAVYRTMGCVYDKRPKGEPPPRWMSQVVTGADVPDEDLECEVVVVGTGAGGAVVAKELAEQGVAVVMVEEGRFHTREEFTGRTAEMQAKLYRNAGATFAVGNAFIPIPIGMTVGGTTTINSGTCYRTPDRVLAKWRTDLGLAEFTPEHMAPYFEKVERELRVEPAKMQHVGAVGEVVARGCEALGWHHAPLRRNAPDCDGQGVCALGCPTDAKRSTNVSYVPMALDRAAMLLAGVRAERILTDRGRAAGIEGKILGTDRRVRVRAKAVVLACGALLTPVFLMRQKLGGASGRLGRNLTIHPALSLSALFDEPIRAYNSIPQGYACEEFHEEGVLMEGGTVPLDSSAVQFNLVGRRLVEVLDAYDRVAVFGAMIEDSGAGSIRMAPGGRPVVWYWVSRRDTRRLQRAAALIAEIFFAAGAERVYPVVQGYGEFRSMDEVRRFAQARIPARDFTLAAFHPLGTCRMGPDPKTSVLNPSQELHDLPGLFVCDGSAVSTSPAVNPQITIMAMATRAAERIAKRVG